MACKPLTINIVQIETAEVGSGDHQNLVMMVNQVWRTTEPFISRRKGEVATYRR
jgi:hypothetical protein